MVLITSCRKKALNTKCAHEQNEKEVFMGTPDKIEEFRMNAKVFLKSERKTTSTLKFRKRKKSIIRCLYLT